MHVMAYNLWSWCLHNTIVYLCSICIVGACSAILTFSLLREKPWAKDADHNDSYTIKSVYFNNSIGIVNCLMHRSNSKQQWLYFPWGDNG